MKLNFNKNLEKIKKIIPDKKTAILGAAMMASLVSAKATENPKKVFSEKIKTETGYTKEVVSDLLNISSFCKTGTTEFVNKEMYEAAKNAVRNFLKNVDFDKYVIKIVGKYSIERPWEGNEKLKEDRRALGEQIVQEVLHERFSDEQMKKITIESYATGQSIYDIGYSKEDIAKMPKETLDALIDKTQGIDISVEKNKEIHINNVIEKIKQEYKDIYGVIIDHSKSMANEAKEVSLIVTNINKSEDKDIKIFNLEGGNDEAHIKTLLNILEKAPKNFLDQKEILILTDEPDNAVKSIEEYSGLVDQVLKLAEEKKYKIKIKIFNPDPSMQGFKVVDLGLNPNALYLSSEFKKTGVSNVFLEKKLSEWYKSLRG